MSYTRDGWVDAFLVGVGNTAPSPFTRAWVKAWTIEETADPIEKGAAFNLLNTTEGGPGVVSEFNDAHVKNFDSFEHGVAANVAALVGGPIFYYSHLAKALQTNDEASLRGPTPEISKEIDTWGTGHASDIAKRAASMIVPVILNSAGEVADLVDVSQFEGGESAYECVAFAVALVRYAGPPGQGPRGTGEQVDQLADFWYTRLEGDNSARNTSGMSLASEYTMLAGLGLVYEPLTVSVGAIKTALGQGHLVLITGAETGMFDLDLGDRIPYSWTPTGNHCIVATGIAPDGNLLVHDPASIGPTGVRKGPRRYDVDKLQLVSVTAVIPSWLLPPSPTPEKDPFHMITITSPNVSDFFEEVSPTEWRCKPNGVTITGDILAFYQQMNGLTWLSLPMAQASPIEGSKHGASQQPFKNVWVRSDPGFEYDRPVGLSSGHVYLAHLYETLTDDPRIHQLMEQVAAKDTVLKEIHTLSSPS